MSDFTTKASLLTITVCGLSLDLVLVLFLPEEQRAALPTLLRQVYLAAAGI